MNFTKTQFVLNRSTQRTQSTYFSPFPLLPPVQILAFAVLAISLFSLLIHGNANAQCYVDPYTGQRICTRPSVVPADTASNVDASAHCRISVADGTTGSGTLVARDVNVGLVLTCSHLFDTSNSQIIVTFPNGRRFGARLVDLDRAHDLAALAIQRPELEPLASTDEDAVGILTACGFGSNGSFRCVKGNITGHPTAVGAIYPSTTITGAVRPGDSGGGVLNTRGHVVGVVWGQRDGQTYATCGQPVRDFLDRVRNKLFTPNTTTPHVVQKTPPSSAPSPQSPTPTPQPDWQAWSTELDARLRVLDAKKQDRGDYLRHGDLNAYLRTDDAGKLTGDLAPRTEVETKLGALSSKFESVHHVVESIREHVEQISVNREGFLQGVSAAKVAIGALGLSGPLAAAVVIAGGLVGRRVRSRLTSLESTIHTPTLNPKRSTLNPVAVDSPPPPQQTVRETHYVPVEQDSFSKAHQWASEHVARKYPGATEVLQAQESLIKQFLAAK